MDGKAKEKVYYIKPSSDNKLFTKQIYAPSDREKAPNDSIFTKNMQCHDNILAMLKTIVEFNLLPENLLHNRGIVNVFTGAPDSFLYNRLQYASQL